MDSRRIDGVLPRNCRILIKSSYVFFDLDIMEAQRVLSLSLGPYDQDFWEKCQEMEAMQDKRSNFEEEILHKAIKKGRFDGN